VPTAGAWSEIVATGLRAVPLAWAFLALGGLASLLVGHVRLHRLLRHRSPIRLGSHPDLSNLRVARELKTPVALLSGELCLPAAALSDLSGEELDAIIAHEQEHIRRRDPAWLLLSSVLCRLLFFQPLNWIAAQRLRALAEFLCDSSAVRQTSRVAVAAALVSVSRWVGSQRLVATGMASPESLTMRRVRRILEERANPDSMGRIVPVAVLILISLAVVGPGVALDADGTRPRYTIAATDDGGPFKVTIERGRVIGVTLNGAPVQPSEIQQEGNLVRVRPAGGPALELTLTDAGGMRWTSRPRSHSLD
jgi:beta-lactamase regulating signal transducer with metallopeptidase domain